jgi:DNA-nicking Smr family endonuclease
VKRPLRPEELRLWGKVAATVHPAAGRHPPKGLPLPPPVEAAPIPAPNPGAKAKPKPAPNPASIAISAKPATPRRLVSAPEAIEPGRKRRIVRERDPTGPRLDLHGLTQDAARAALAAFLRRAQADGWRSVLVITGKGTQGDGVLRRMTPEWLADPALRDLIAGVSEAHRRHGGFGALYVALKRPSRG